MKKPQSSVSPDAAAGAPHPHGARHVVKKPVPSSSWPRDIAVWFICAEAAPFAKVGGLGDVAGELPRMLTSAGVPVTLCLPLHGGVMVPDDAQITELPGLPAWIGPACVHQWERDGLRIAMYALPRWFGRDRIYSWPDDNERFAAFCMAVARHVVLAEIPPGVLHLNDWHTASLALLAASARVSGEQPPTALASARTLLTLHSLQYQGWASLSLLFLLDPDGSAAQRDLQLAPYGYNALRSGMLHADAINTVSPTHAREILRPGEGFGLEQVLAQRVRDLPKGLYRGILNRIGDGWDPEHDPALPCRFGSRTLAGRNGNRIALRRELGLADTDHPMAAYVGRLADGKGLPLLAEAVEAWLAEGLQLIVLGVGDPALEARMAALAVRWPERMVFRCAFDPALARRIYGGADLFLMPSEREACGISQQIAMRYGCIPVVRATGGLADTVRNGVNGFVFHKPAATALDRAVRRAWHRFRDADAWAAMQRAAMSASAGWRTSAQAYIEMYLDLLSSGDDAPGADCAAKGGTWTGRLAPDT